MSVTKPVTQVDLNQPGQKRIKIPASLQKQLNELGRRQKKGERILVLVRKDTIKMNELDPQVVAHQLREKFSEIDKMTPFFIYAIDRYQSNVMSEDSRKILQRALFLVGRISTRDLTDRYGNIGVVQKALNILQKDYGRKDGCGGNKFGNNTKAMLLLELAKISKCGNRYTVLVPK
jgi:hypothetical protein